MARDIVDDARDTPNVELSVQVRQWLANVPEHATIMRLLVRTPWQIPEGTPREGRRPPPWVRSQAACAALLQSTVDAFDPCR